jgi:four helix bundle protein
MGKFVLKDKSYRFAIDIVHLCRHLQTEQKEYVISKQLLRSGTAIGALVREAEFGESRADFSHKMSIALKEANETYYWLSILHETYSGSKTEDIIILQNVCRELIAILVTIVKKTKSRNQTFTFYLLPFTSN